MFRLSNILAAVSLWFQTMPFLKRDRQKNTFDRFDSFWYLALHWYLIQVPHVSMKLHIPGNVNKCSEKVYDAYDWLVLTSASHLCNTQHTAACHFHLALLLWSLTFRKDCKIYTVSVCGRYTIYCGSVWKVHNLLWKSSNPNYINRLCWSGKIYLHYR